MINWDGKERRKNGVDLKIFAAETTIHLKDQSDKLNEIKTDITGIKNSFVSLDKTTCFMVSNLNERITTLPCETRKSWYQGMSRQMAFMWMVLGVYILALFGIIAKVFAK